MSDYSYKLQEVFSLAQYEAARYDSSYLETWHVLLAMVGIRDSIAGLTFAEYEDKVRFEDYESAAILAMGRSPRDNVAVTFRPQSRALSEVLDLAQKIQKVTGSEAVGTEHVLFAILVNKDLLATRLLELAGFKYKDDGDSLRLLDLRKSLERNAGFTKENIKAIHTLRSPKPAKAGATSQI